MSIFKKVVAGCVLLPVALIASCFGKMYIDKKMYELPGKVLVSDTQPTQKLTSAMQVAEALDSYVQPRFEILRDATFGQFRLVTRKHAGIVQLKVDSLKEHQLIANINATKNDYVVNLLHCAAIPRYSTLNVEPKLQMLYFNQEPLAPSTFMGSRRTSPEVAEEHHFALASIEKKAKTALPTLMKGKEYRTQEAEWSVLMRPVVASKQECLSCHDSKKIGDTLGVMIYAVRAPKGDILKKISLR